MRKSLVLLIFCCVLSIGAFSQGADNPLERFQDYLSQKINADSAFYMLKMMATGKKYMAVIGIPVHNILALYLKSPDSDYAQANASAPGNERSLGLRVLEMCSTDTNAQLLKTLLPLQLLVQAQEAGDDTIRLNCVGNAMLRVVADTKAFYSNRAARYALAMYRSMKAKPGMQSLSQEIFNRTYEALQAGQVVPNEGATRAELDRRAWYRYLFAAANYTKASETTDIGQQRLYLEKSFHFSPDVIDRQHSAAYFYDRLFLFNEQHESFKDDYISLVENDADQSSVQTLLLQAALTDPAYKTRLQRLYEANHAKGNFEKYWSDRVELTAMDAPSFTLFKTDSTQFSVETHAGKWTLLDFWGTWCLPCREEHPKLQQFYDSVIRPNTEKFLLLTIACRDSLGDVKSYMRDKGFSFPVALSDGKIESRFHVQGYPTKILITPRNRYIVVPFGEDWVHFVRAYTGL